MRFLRVLVTGHCGMIGSNVYRLLGSPQGAEADLQSGQDLRLYGVCQGMVASKSQVYQLASPTVGIGYSQEHHGELFTDASIIALNMLRASFSAGVKRYLFVSSSCVYAETPLAVTEDSPFGPEPGNEGYGWAKRVGELQAKLLPMEVVIARPTNIYGPSYLWNRPENQLHVIPALIRKMLRGDPEIVVWGSGAQTRSFQYESDTATLLIELMKHGKSKEAYNLGGQEVTIRELVTLLVDYCGYQGRIVYDGTKPEGPKRKAQDITKLKALALEHTPEKYIMLEEGLARTVEAARKAWS